MADQAPVLLKQAMVMRRSRQDDLVGLVEFALRYEDGGRQLIAAITIEKARWDELGQPKEVTVDVRPDVEGQALVLSYVADESTYGYVTFDLRCDGGRRLIAAISLQRARWDEMGQPEQVTVEIRPGALLDEGSLTLTSRRKKTIWTNLKAR